MIMRKLNKFALMGAIALTGTAGFTACSSDDVLGENGPSISSGETVKTQFTINVPAGGPSTRLSDDIVQGQNRPVFRGMNNINMFAFQTTNTNTPVATTSNPSEIYLGMGGIEANGGLQEETNAKVYYDMEVPTGVNRFLFYGEATKAAGATNAQNGYLKATYPSATTGSVSEIKFELGTIAESGNTATESTLLDALNKVVQSNHESDYWYSSTDAGLKNLYEGFIQLKAGSASSIRQTLAWLKEGLNSGNFTINDNDLKSAIITNIDAAIGENGTLKDLTYPRDLGLPDGAVQLKYDDATHAFSYATSEADGGSSITVGSSAAKISDYVYPSALYYWAESPILTSSEVVSDRYTTNWETCLGLYTGGGTAVDANTRSIALKNEINYAVARLDLSAWFDAQSGTVKDNVGNNVDVTTTTGGMNLVGLLVGGQKDLTYDFSTPVTDAAEKSVYDAAITSTALGETTTTNVLARTLLLETAKDAKIRFALELENNTGESFVGIDGTIPAGGRFYLIGELEPSTAAAGMENRVFKQDFYTTAKVSISSLAHAYNTIPDLREPKLELGLSVNLEWRKGLESNVTID